MLSSCKKNEEEYTVVSDIRAQLKWDIPKFDTVLLHSNWSCLQRSYLSKLPADINAVSCGQEHKRFQNFGPIYPARHPQKSCTDVRRRR